LIALETGYNDGTTTPTGETDAILASSIDLTPLSGNDIERNFLRPYFGNASKKPGEKHGQVQIQVELAASGTAGTAPAVSTLLRVCSFSEVVTEAESVVYAPVSDNEDSAVIYAHMDGNLHKLRGARGSAQLTLNAESMPMLQVTLYGLYSPVTKAELPTVTLDQWIDGIAINTDNTPPLKVFGTDAPFTQFSLNMANNVVHQKIVGMRNIVVTGRSPSGAMTIADPGVDVVDFFAKSKAAETGPIQFIHGKTPGSIIEIAMPKCGIESPTYADSDGTQMLSINYSPEPVAGNDEVTITFK
jgi:hypothetical protein